MLIEPDRLLLFMAAALALNLTPGNDMLFIISQGLRSGRRAGIAASLGIATGAVGHTLLAAFGLAALIAAHPLAFEVIRWTGVGYLVWLAIRAIARPSLAVALQEPREAGGARRAWREGVLVNLLNPKVGLFFLAFLPQFVDPSAGSAVLQFLLLSTLFNVQGTILNALIGGFAGGIGRKLIESRPIARALEVATGVIFLGLAARLALERR